MNKEEILSLLDLLITRGNEILKMSSKSDPTYLNNDGSYAYSAWRMKTLDFLNKFLAYDSNYIIAIRDVEKSYAHDITCLKKCVHYLHSIKDDIQEGFFSLEASNANGNHDKAKSKKIFIVHGHNDTMKLAAYNVIRQLGLTPVILHEQPNKGRTIIEKFEYYSKDIGFAVVLISADDKMENGKYRARQNVILELGYFIASLGRNNVVALYEQSPHKADIPSDISGVLFEPYDKPEGGWRFELVQELKAAGFDVDANALI